MRFGRVQGIFYRLSSAPHRTDRRQWARVEAVVRAIGNPPS